MSVGRLSLSASWELIVTPVTPRKARSTLPLFLSWLAISLALLIGNGEADADVAAAAAVAICELIPITRPSTVDQRAAGVAGVDGGVRLDHVLDREAVGSLDLARERADDAGRDRAVEAERVADRHHGVADLRLGGVAERERVELVLVDVHLQQRDVVAGVLADQLGV